MHCFSCPPSDALLRTSERRMRCSLPTSVAGRGSRTSRISGMPGNAGSVLGSGRCQNLDATRNRSSPASPAASCPPACHLSTFPPKLAMPRSNAARRYSGTACRVLVQVKAHRMPRQLRATTSCREARCAMSTSSQNLTRCGRCSCTRVRLVQYHARACDISQAAAHPRYASARQDLVSIN